jgi:hypothetical protein
MQRNCGNFRGIRAIGAGHDDYGFRSWAVGIIQGFLAAPRPAC